MVDIILEDDAFDISSIIVGSEPNTATIDLEGVGEIIDSMICFVDPVDIYILKVCSAACFLEWHLYLIICLPFDVCLTYPSVVDRRII